MPLSDYLALWVRPRCLCCCPNDGARVHWPSTVSAPTIENMASGRYPYLKTMYLASKPDAPASVGKFVAFVRSDAGRRILVSTGHIGVPATAPSTLAANR